MSPVSKGISEEQYKKISQQIEQQLQKQIYDSLTRFLNEDIIAQQNPPQSAAQASSPQPAAPTTGPNQSSGQIENLFQGIANMLGNAVNFSMSTLAQQKRMYLQQMQQQLRAQMAAQNPNDPTNNRS